MSMHSEHDGESKKEDNDGDDASRRGEHHSGGQSHQMKGMYLRFAAMILTAMVVMYFVMFVGSWELDHVRFSQSRVFMAVTMGGTMGLIMLAWMLNMYKNAKANIAVVAVSVLLLDGGRGGGTPRTGRRGHRAPLVPGPLI